MINYLRAEFIKERRSANSKLKFIVPIIFIVFNFLMILLMGESPSGKSYIMATAFNWYPVMILPVVLSLLVLNILSKEKLEHIFFMRTLNLSVEKVFIAKNILVVFELFVILCISSTLIYFASFFTFNDDINIKILIIASLCLLIGSLPVIAISFLVYKLFSKKIILMLMNFLFTFAGAIIAPTYYWKFFPWAYSLRVLSPIIEVHPSGTFLESSSPLMQMNNSYLGLMLSITLYFLLSILILFIEKRRNHV